MNTNTASNPAKGQNAWLPAALVLVACALVYWVGLGGRPFGSSEGHRVAPAWAMLESGDWWRQEMFGQEYLRKPPGMPWAIAATSSVLGQTEFGARAASALAMTLGALAALAFGTRWFGRAGGIACGLMHAGLPLFWSPGRTAEIEALNNLGTQLAALAMIDLVLSGGAATRWMARVRALPQPIDAEERGPRLTPPPGSDDGGGRPASLAWLMMTLAAAGLMIAGLAKGPASLPVLGGVLIGGAVALRSYRAPCRWPIGVALAAAGCVLWLIAQRFYSVNSDPDAIRQSAEDFLWSGGVRKVVSLAPVALASALPASLTFLFVWGKDAEQEAAASGSNATVRALAAARILAWTWVVSVVIMIVAGVSNPRYAMPAAFVFPMLCGFVVRGVWGVRASFTPARRKLAKSMTFRNHASWPVVLCAAALLIAQTKARRSVDEFSSRAAGRFIAERIGAGPVWADDLIEARPDVLLYAERGGGPQKHAVRPLWKKHEMQRAELPPPGECLIVRSDSQSTERRRYGEAIADGKLALIGERRLGAYEFEIYRVK